MSPFVDLDEEEPTRLERIIAWAIYLVGSSFCLFLLGLALCPVVPF